MTIYSQACRDLAAFVASVKGPAPAPETSLAIRRVLELADEVDEREAPHKHGYSVVMRGGCAVLKPDPDVPGQGLSGSILQDEAWAREVERLHREAELNADVAAVRAENQRLRAEVTVSRALLGAVGVIVAQQPQAVPGSCARLTFDIPEAHAP